MKQSEKSRLTKQRIMQAALKEFSEFPFEKASISAMCEKNGLPKGLVYHNFGGKDEIYLNCVDEAFSALNEYLKMQVNLVEGDSEESIKAYFSARYRFFNENTTYKKIFYSAVFQYPIHLKEDIKKLRSKLEVTNNAILSEILPMVGLRSGVNEKQAKEYIGAFTQFYDIYFKKKFISEEWESTVDLYELYVQKALEFLLYGIAGKA